MARSLKKTTAPKSTNRKPLPPPERPEDNINVDEIDIRDPDYDNKHSSLLKVDDNGTRGQKHVITCVCCGKPKYEDYFVLNRYSYVFSGIWNRVPICKECLDMLYRKFSMQYEPMTCCAAITAIMDMPYNEAFARTCVEDGRFKIGNYARGQNIAQLKNKTFIDSIQNGEFFDTKDKLKTEVEKHWEPQDRKNKKYVINKFGL